LARRKPTPRPGGTKAARPAKRNPRKRPSPAPAKPADGTVRLQKLLAEAGHGSRRACEALMADGRVHVDGKPVVQLGSRVDPARQRVTLDGETVQVERKVYYLVNKPRGVLCTNSDPAGRPRVIDLLPSVPQRVYTVGRLDQYSEGLLLVTNDGELAYRLVHPRYGVKKTYLATVQGSPSPETLRRVAQGVWSSDGKLRADRVRFKKRVGKSTSEVEVVLREGRNRQVRRMLAKVGHKVLRLKRIAIDRLTIKGLPTGQTRRLTRAEVTYLRKQFLPTSGA